jgi:hypothetical protein
MEADMPRRVIAWLIALVTVFAATISAAAAAGPAAAGSASASTVRTAAKPPPVSELWGVSCVSPKFCLAVGGGAAEKWNGVTWKNMAVRLTPTGGYLLHVSCVSTAFCMAVGFFGKGANHYALADVWNGKAWTPAEPPAPGGNSTFLDGVSCVSPKSCAATGAYTANSVLVALGESWNGKRWNRTRPIVPAGAEDSDMPGVSCVRGTSYCVAAGFYYSKTGANELIESWNGRNWKLMQAVPFPAGSSDGGLTGISCSSVKSCVAVGEDDQSYLSDIEEIWNGKSWALTSVDWQSSPITVGYSSLSDASCVAANHCVAVGIAYDIGLGNHAGTAIWNGSAWTGTAIAAPGGQYGLFNDVSCLSVKYCVAVGELGGLGLPGTGLSGIWNGKSWKLVLAP